jgi:RNA polymerase sigma-70 factor (ECF subfamily)
MKVIPLHQEEKELIDLAIDNNRQAQKQIYDQFSAKMLGVCRKYISDIHHAEDIMLSLIHI